MLLPLVPAGVEQADETTGVGINGGEIASLMAVAGEASPGQVLRYCAPSVLGRDHMVRFVRHPGVVLVE
jgi:hypothetical protein